MKKILLDTNFFLVPFQLGINIFSEFERVLDEPFELMTISSVKAELEKLAKSGKTEERSAAALAIQIARGIPVVETSNRGDEAIIGYAASHKNVMVATNDSGLRKKLRAIRVRTIFVRGKNKLQID